jgi:phage-related minor tail protein
MDRVTDSTGSLGEAWAAVSNTIKIRFDQAISQAHVSMISLGQSLATAVIPLIEKLIKKLEDLTKWFNSLSEQQRQNTLKFK